MPCLMRYRTKCCADDTDNNECRNNKHYVVKHQAEKEIN